MLPQAIAGTPAPFNRWAAKRSGRRLAVAAGNGDDLASPAHVREPRRRRIRFPRPPARSTAAGGSVGYGHSRRQSHQIDAGEGGDRTNGPANSSATDGATRCQRFAVGRVVARIGNANDGALALQPFGHRQPGLTEPDTRTRLPLSSISAVSRSIARSARA
jgi:hypothetical protein